MDIYIGTIVAFAGIVEPQDWKFCNGQLLNISEYQALYSLLGTTYGGNGTTNFALPDLRNRLVVGSGNGVGLTPRTLGQNGGADSVSLVGANLPMHNHDLMVTTNNATASTPASNCMLGPISNSSYNFYDSAVDKTNPSSLKSLNSVSISTEGSNNPAGSDPHENRQPFIAINYIICVNGLYPSSY